MSQLPSHVALPQLLSHSLSDLTALRLTYGAPHCGMDFDRGLFGMTLGDAEALARVLPLAETLHTLDLTGSALDDEKAREEKRSLAKRCGAMRSDAGRVFDQAFDQAF